MTIVDTCAIIDWLAGTRTAATAHLQTLVEEGGAVGVLGLIRFELLQGIRAEREVARITTALKFFEHYEMNGYSAYDLAAARYVGLRRKGITVRSSIDVLIASFCIDREFILLTSDRDYRSFAERLGLRLAVPV